MAKKLTKAAPRTRKTATKSTPTVEIKTSKQNMVLTMLRRAKGASVAEIVEATGWQPHSVRGFFAGALKKRLKIDVVSEKDAETGDRRYYVAPIKS